MKFNSRILPDTLNNIELILDQGIDVVCAGLDQDSRGKRHGKPHL